VVHSIVLYAAPVWAAEARAFRRICALLHGVQRRVASRAIRGYRTISHAAATVLAGQPPLELLASMRQEVYCELAELRRRNQGLAPLPRAVRLVKVRALQRLLAAWSAWLCRPGMANGKVVQADQPRLVSWLEGGWGGLAYRATQIITGHGCFGKFLCRIGRERTTRCHHCGAPEDSAHHTFEECSEWAQQRRVLAAVVGDDLSLPAIFDAILGSERSWKALLTFSEEVIRKKEEEEERARRGETAGRGRGAAGDGGGVWRNRLRRRPLAHLVD